MPESFFHLSAKEQEEALQVASSASGRPAHLLENDTRAGAFRPGPRGSGELFELRPDLLFGHNQLGHHGGVKNVLALRTAQTLPLCLADSSPQTTCGPSPH